MKVVAAMANLCYMEFSIKTVNMPEGVALNTMVSWLLKGGFDFFVFNDDGTFHIPEGEPPTIPRNWIIDPEHYVVQQYTKRIPSLNLAALPEDIRNVLEAMDEYVKTVETRVQQLEQRFAMMQRMGQIFRNGIPTSPYPYASPTPPFNWQPPGGPRYQPHRDTVPPGYNDRPDFHQPFFSEEIDFSQQPGWGRPPRR